MPPLSAFGFRIQFIHRFQPHSEHMDIKCALANEIFVVRVVVPCPSPHTVYNGTYTQTLSAVHCFSQQQNMQLAQYPHPVCSVCVCVHTTYSIFLNTLLSLPLDCTPLLSKCAPSARVCTLLMDVLRAFYYYYYYYFLRFLPCFVQYLRCIIMFRPADTIAGPHDRQNATITARLPQFSGKNKNMKKVSRYTRI